MIPDHVARGFVFEAVPTPREKFGGKDMFGLNWKYIDVAGGSMSEGKLFDDANDWREYVHFPDIDSWDWEGSAEMNKEYLASGPKILWMLNGCWFERLISFMTFEGAAMALLDDDQLDAIKELIHETTSLYMRIVDKCCQYYDFPGFCIHDDWGSQMAPFFSEAVAREVFLPEMKRFCDHVHSHGKFIDLHSCGKGETRCGVFVDAGFDSWTPMAMNDTDKLWRQDRHLRGLQRTGAPRNRFRRGAPRRRPVLCRQVCQARPPLRVQLYVLQPRLSDPRLPGRAVQSLPHRLLRPGISPHRREKVRRNCYAAYKQ